MRATETIVVVDVDVDVVFFLFSLCLQIVVILWKYRVRQNDGLGVCFSNATTCDFPDYVDEARRRHCPL